VPPGGSGPLWTDNVSGTQSPFHWQNTGQNNSTNYDGGTFKTVFFAWPLEGLTDLDDRAEALEAVLEWFGGCAAPCNPVQGADFTWLPITPTAGTPVAFTGTVAAGDLPITYTWKLDVGTWQEGHVVTHRYSTPGVYTVVMTATNCATATATATHTLIVVQPPTCTAVAILSVTTGISGCAVTLSAELTGDPPFTYLWDFGPLGTSTATNPLVDFQATGVYTGTLSVWNCGNAEPATSAFTVEVVCSRWAVYLPIVSKNYP
jgi:PKD repeat protein